MLCRLELVASSVSDSEYAYRLSELYNSPEFKSAASVQTWFEKKWLPQHKVVMIKSTNWLVC